MHVGDVVEVISSKAKHIAEIVEIGVESCHFKLRTETFCFMWRDRSELRLIERNGQPINQPEKTIKTSEQLQNLAKNVASFVEAISEAADMAEYFEAKENGENAMREINKKLGERVDELESKLRGEKQSKEEWKEECSNLEAKLQHANSLLETQRRLMGIPGYVGLMIYVSEFSQKHQISISSVWDMFFSVCKRAVFTIPEAPEPVEPPVIN